MDNALRFVDADGHILEHPTGMLDYAPAEWRDRIWHIETDADGEEWTSFYGARRSANSSASAGTAGMSNADRERAMRRELKYTEVRPAAYNAKPRLEDMTADDIDISVLYPTLLLGLPSHPDVGPEAEQRNFDNIFFTQAIANPVDMMTTLTFITAGGVGARFPDTRFVFLEANGGWLVPWLERLDHHYDIFGWDVPTLKMPPSEYFRR